VGLGALVLAGFVGSVVGPHFKTASSSTTTTTTFLHPVGTTTSTPSSPSTTSTIARSSVKILVANGTQEPNAGSHFSQELQQQGWSVSVPQNATSAASTTTIYYAPSQQPAATLVASELGVAMTAVQPLTTAVPVATVAGLDIVVVLGPDLAGSGFPAATVPATTVPTT
jgi:hypothetical protein